ncbi:MAG: hypothetical protein MZW92_78420 [Comamonadaceae bacterium]|nr:hypothetical protein [Comamonadaceae bacterium]
MMLGRDTRLTRGQRYHFLAGWLPWMADGFNLMFNLPPRWPGRWRWWLFPRHVQPPLVIFAVLPLSLFVFKLVKLLHLYRTRVGANLRQTIAAALAGLGPRAHRRRGHAERVRLQVRSAVLPHAEAGARATRSGRRLPRHGRRPS